MSNLTSPPLTCIEFPSLLEPSDPYGFFLCRASRYPSRLFSLLSQVLLFVVYYTLSIVCPTLGASVTVVVICTEAYKIIETFECEDDSLLIFPDEFKLLFVY